jgi:hypothetical protein
MTEFLTVEKRVVQMALWALSTVGMWEKNSGDLLSAHQKVAQ